MKANVLSRRDTQNEQPRAFLCAVVLTKNEEIHIGRCLESLVDLVDEVLVVDSFSTDNTVEIATAHGARVLEHAFKNYAAQFSWALSQLDPRTTWVMRIDADECPDEVLRKAMAEAMREAPDSVSAMTVQLREHFAGGPIRFGGRGKMRLLRIFRPALASIEQRWMDEHIIVSSGTSIDLPGLLLHRNEKPISEWMQKHITYSMREAVDALDGKYQLFSESRRQSERRTQTKLGRVIYYAIGGSLAPFLFFLYRYIFRLGFLDGKAGYLYHFLQGYWYRTLVAMQIAELERHMRSCTTNEQRIAVIAARTGLSI